MFCGISQPEIAQKTVGCKKQLRVTYDIPYPFFFTYLVLKKTGFVP